MNKLKKPRKPRSGVARAAIQRKAGPFTKRKVQLCYLCADTGLEMKRRGTDDFVAVPCSNCQGYDDEH